MERRSFLTGFLDIVWSGRGLRTHLWKVLETEVLLTGVKTSLEVETVRCLNPLLFLQMLLDNEWKTILLLDIVTYSQCNKRHCRVLFFSMISISSVNNPRKMGIFKHKIWASWVLKTPVVNLVTVDNFIKLTQNCNIFATSWKKWPKITKCFNKFVSGWYFVLLPRNNRSLDSSSLWHNLVEQIFKINDKQSSE